MYSALKTIPGPDTEKQSAWKPETVIKSCALSQFEQGTTSYVCWVDNQPCHLIAAFSATLLERAGAGGHTDGIEKTAWALPCQDCRGNKYAAENLAKLRLGQLERQILLNAVHYDEKNGMVFEPNQNTRAQKEAIRRAILKLWRSGLVLIGWDRREQQTRKGRGRWKNLTTNRDYYRRAVWLSALGVTVVKQIRPELETGKPIRWAKHLPVILNNITLEGENELLAKLHKNLEGRVRAQQFLISVYADKSAPDVLEAKQEIRLLASVADSIALTVNGRLAGTGATA